MKMANEVDRQVVLNKFSLMAWKRKSTGDSIGKPIKNDGNIIRRAEGDHPEKFGKEQRKENNKTYGLDDVQINPSSYINLNESLSRFPLHDVPKAIEKTEILSNIKTELIIKEILAQNPRNFFKKIKPGSDKFYEFYMTEDFFETAVKILASRSSTKNDEDDEDFVPAPENKESYSNTTFSQKNSDSYSKEVKNVPSEHTSDYEKCDGNSSRYENEASVVNNQYHNYISGSRSSNINAIVTEDQDINKCIEMPNNVQTLVSQNELLTRPVQYTFQNECNISSQVVTNNASDLPCNLESMHISNSYAAAPVLSYVDGNYCGTQPLVVNSSFREQKIDGCDAQRNRPPIQNIYNPNGSVFVVQPSLSENIEQHNFGNQESWAVRSGTPPTKNTLNMNAPPFVPSVYRNVAPNSNSKVCAGMAGFDISRNVYTPATSNGSSNFQSTPLNCIASADVSLVQIGPKETKTRGRTGYVLNRKPAKPAANSEITRNQTNLKSQISKDLDETLNILDAQRLNSMRCSALISETPNVPVVYNPMVEDSNNEFVILNSSANVPNEMKVPQYLVPLTASCANAFGNDCETGINVLNDDKSLIPACVMTVKNNETYPDRVLWSYQVPPPRQQNNSDKIPFENLAPSSVFQNHVHFTRNQNKSDSITINIEDDGLLDFAQQIPVKPILKHNQMTENVVGFNYNEPVEEQTTKNLPKKVSFIV